MISSQASAEPESEPQAAQTSTPSPKFEFGLGSLVSRHEQLFLSEYRSDVIFRVGSTGQLMHGHKLILTVASEVFFNQFNGNFDEAKQDNRENPIVVEDIEPATFTEVLRYIYYEQVELTIENIIDIYYAADKYLLTDLKGVCENFLTEANVMAVFKDNRRYGFANVDERCLQIIRNNPIKYFQSNDFLTLTQPALELITGCRTMNCLKEQLCEAIEKWCKANDSKALILPNWEALQCHKLYFASQSNYSPKVITDFTIYSKQNLFIHGLGVFVGMQWNSSSKPTTAEVTVTIGSSNISVSKHVSVGKHIYVEEILLEKIPMNYCRVRVTIKDNVNTSFFHLNYHNSTHTFLHGLSITHGYDKNNCVAYLLYTDDD